MARGPKADPVQVHLDNYTNDHPGLVGHMIDEHPCLHAQWDAGDTLTDLSGLHHVAHGRPDGMDRGMIRPGRIDVIVSAGNGHAHLH